jgi:hypothetical protein
VSAIAFADLPAADRCGAIKLWLESAGKLSEQKIFDEISRQYPLFIEFGEAALFEQFWGLVKEIRELLTATYVVVPIYGRKLSGEEAVLLFKEHHAWLDQPTLMKLWHFGNWCFDKG